VHTQEHTLPGSSTDAALARQVLGGDQEAFELLIQRYHLPLFHFICRFLGDSDLAHDVLQQVFLRLYTSLPALVARDSFRFWLFRVVHHCCVDELRRKHRYTLHFSQLENNEGELTGLCDIPDPGLLPEEVVERRDLQVLLQQAIETLPPKLRSVTILRYSSQLSFPEIGKILGMPQATAKTYFHRAKVLLRKKILVRC